MPNNPATYPTNKKTNLKNRNVKLKEKSGTAVRCRHWFWYFA